MVERFYAPGALFAAFWGAHASRPAAARRLPERPCRRISTSPQIHLARPSRNQRRLILAIHRFRRCTQIKDPKATIAARGPWVPLVVEAVGLDRFKFAAARLTSLRRCEPPTRVRSFALAAMSPSPGESCLRRRGRRRYRVPSWIQRSVDKDNAVTLHQDLLCLRCRSWFKILAEKQHSHRLSYRFV